MGEAACKSGRLGGAAWTPARHPYPQHRARVGGLGTSSVSTVPLPKGKASVQLCTWRSVDT